MIISLRRVALPKKSAHSHSTPTTSTLPTTTHSCISSNCTNSFFVFNWRQFVSLIAVDHFLQLLDPSTSANVCVCTRAIGCYEMNSIRFARAEEKKFSNFRRRQMDLFVGFARYLLIRDFVVRMTMRMREREMERIRRRSKRCEMKMIDWQ